MGRHIPALLLVLQLHEHPVEGDVGNRRGARTSGLDGPGGQQRFIQRGSCCVQIEGIAVCGVGTAFLEPEIGLIKGAACLQHHCIDNLYRVAGAALQNQMMRQRIELPALKELGATLPEIKRPPHQSLPLPALGRVHRAGASRISTRLAHKGRLVERLQLRQPIHHLSDAGRVLAMQAQPDVVIQAVEAEHEGKRQPDQLHRILPVRDGPERRLLPRFLELLFQLYHPCTQPYQFIIIHIHCRFLPVQLNTAPRRFNQRGCVTPVQSCCQPAHPGDSNELGL